MSTLASLNLSECHYIRDAIQKELRHLTAITSLSCKMEICEGILEMKELKLLTALTHLNLRHSDHVTDAISKELGHLTE